MTRDEIVVLASMVAASVLLPLLAATGLGWNPWLCVVLGVAGLASTMLVVRRTAYRRRQEALRAEMRQPPPPPAPPAPTPPPVPSSQVTAVPVPTNEFDYHFLFSATVHWNHLHYGNALDAEAIARKVVLDRACELTLGCAPGNPALTQIHLAAALGVRLLDPSGAVEVWADGVSLGLPDDDRDRLARLAAIRKQKTVWEHERAFEKDKREYLGDDVLSTPGRAVVWKLSKDFDRIQETVGLISTLRELTAAANDHALPAPEPVVQPQPVLTEENAWHVDPAPATGFHVGPVDPAPTNGFHDERVDPVEAFVSGVFGDEDSGQRDLFAEQVATLVDKHGLTTDIQQRTDEAPAAPDPAPTDDAEETAAADDSEQPPQP